MLEGIVRWQTAGCCPTPAPLVAGSGHPLENGAWYVKHTAAGTAVLCIFLLAARVTYNAGPPRA